MNCKRKYISGLFIYCVIIFLSQNEVHAQQLAFPGAEGYGRYTSGGRGGVVIEVTNLNDTGIGSLRAAIQSSQTRTVVFRISGTIELNSDLRIMYGNITIAGQTAPGDGICIKNYPLTVDADNVIIRYMHFRLGDEKDVEADALGGRYHSNIVIDHCSASWSVDECVSFYANEYVTVQWCLISESLYESVHEKGRHGYGGIWGGKNCTFHHNLLAHHSSRNPRFASVVPIKPENVDSRNNVIYNWGGNSCYGGEGGSFNMVANYYKFGPATGPKDRIAYPDVATGVPVGEWYIEDNYVFGYPEITADNWAGGVQGPNAVNARIYDPKPYAPVVTHPAEVAYQLVLDDVGAVRPKRDSLDARIVWEVRNQTALYGASYGEGTGIIDTPSDVGGWPVLMTYNIPTDSDKDGMPNDWELANGLDSLNESDRNDIAANGYTNLENYLNTLCFRSDYLPAPGNLEAITKSNEEILLKWQEAVLNENGFIIERSTGDTLSFVEIATVSQNDTLFQDSGLNSLTSYYYRIRAFNDSTHSLYSNYTFAKTAYPDGRPLEPDNPYPENEFVDVPINSHLGWNNAGAATSYNVYLGTTNEPEFIGNQTDVTYNPHGLKDSTQYYWRIDAINSFGTTTGNLWSFITENIIDTVVGYWPLNVKTSRTTDESGNNNYAYLMNMESSNWINDGISGKALHFDGIDDHLIVYNNESLTFNILGFTLSFWIRQNVTNKNMPWISKAQYNGESLETGYEIYHASNGTVNFVVNDGTTQSSVQSSDSNFVTGEWVMLTAVRDKKNQSLKLYANKKLIVDEKDSTWDLTQTANLYIGTNIKITDYFEGDLDEVNIFNYTLDSTEIKDLYLNTLTSIKVDNEINIPFEFKISNYPNPFNNSTNITFIIPEFSFVNLSVYNTIGQKVDELVNEQKNIGTYTLQYNMDRLSSGVYFYTIQAGDKSISKKMILIK